LIINNYFLRQPVIQDQKMNIRSYTAQLGKDTAGKDVCVLLILDGVTAITLAPKQEMQASLTLAGLHLKSESHDFLFEKPAQDIVNALKKGLPLVVKHTASNYESAIKVTL